MKLATNKETTVYLEFGFYLLAPILLLWLPADYFDEGIPLCFSRIFFNVECLGCGMTRAIMHLIHLDFERAWAYNPLCVIVFPLLVSFIFFRIKKLFNRLS
jgi:hypothetical protein